MMEHDSTSAARTIVVAVDFSACSEQALLWAVGAADCMDARLVVLHVVHDPGSAPGYYGKTKKLGKHLRRMEDAAAEMMNKFMARMREEHPEIPGNLEHRLVTGLPANRILEVAKEVGAQLIVMGSCGRTGIPHVLLGSKAEKVVQLSPIPVTIVKQG